MREVLDDSFGEKRGGGTRFCGGGPKRGPRTGDFCPGARGGGKWPGKGGPAAILINAYSGDFCHPVLWDAVLAEPLVTTRGQNCPFWAPPPDPPQKPPFLPFFGHFAPPGPPGPPGPPPGPPPPPPQKSFPQRTKKHGDTKNPAHKTFSADSPQKFSPCTNSPRTIPQNDENAKCAKHKLFFLHKSARTNSAQCTKLISRRAQIKISA